MKHVRSALSPESAKRRGVRTRGRLKVSDDVCVCVCDSVRVGSKRRVKHAPPAWRARAAVTKRFKRVAIARAAVIVESVRSSTLA